MPGPMAWVRGAEANYTESTAGAGTRTTGAFNLQTGMLVVVGVCLRDATGLSPTAGTPTDLIGNTYVKVDQGLATANYNHSFWYTWSSGASASNTLSCATGGVTCACAIQVVTFGANGTSSSTVIKITSAPLDTHVVASSAAGSASPNSGPTAAITAPNDLNIGLVCASGNPSISSQTFSTFWGSTNTEPGRTTNVTANNTKLQFNEGGLSASAASTLFTETYSCSIGSNPWSCFCANFKLPPYPLPPSLVVMQAVQRAAVW